MKGAIVIARYGGSWRGIKPKVAAEHGAVGCLIYSDPRDDGYFAGRRLPQGPDAPANGVQRGSVMDMPIYPGDPLTPGVGATKDAKRLALKDAATLTKIPVLPISYGDAQPLLAALAGPVAPEAWRGALPITYHVGPGPAKVHLKLAFNWDLKPLYDVIARIPGAAYPDEWVIRGNHHDAWVNGADDPVSGAVAADGRGARARRAALSRAGSRSARSFTACGTARSPACSARPSGRKRTRRNWRRRPSSYINSDRNGRGYLRMEGSHTLERFVNGVAKDIDDPETSVGRCGGAMQAQRLTSPMGTPAGPRRRLAPVRTCGSTRSAPARITRRSSITSASRR